MFRVATVAAAMIAASALPSGSASAQQPIDPQGRDALKAAMQDEAYASAKFKLFAEQARRTGDTKLADLMARAANMEYGHFLRWAELYRLVGANLENVRAAVRDDVIDDVKLYDRLASEAKARGDDMLAEHFLAVKAQEQRQEDEFRNELDKALNVN
jgi:rubrerythrin